MTNCDDGGDDASNSNCDEGDGQHNDSATPESEAGEQEAIVSSMSGDSPPQESVVTPTAPTATDDVDDDDSDSSDQPGPDLPPTDTSTSDPPPSSDEDGTPSPPPGGAEPCGSTTTPSSASASASPPHAPPDGDDDEAEEEDPTAPPPPPPREGEDGDRQRRKFEVSAQVDPEGNVLANLDVGGDEDVGKPGHEVNDEAEDPIGRPSSIDGPTAGGDDENVGGGTPSSSSAIATTTTTATTLSEVTSGEVEVQEVEMPATSAEAGGDPTPDGGAEGEGAAAETGQEDEAVESDVRPANATSSAPAGAGRPQRRRVEQPRRGGGGAGGRNQPVTRRVAAAPPPPPPPPPPAAAAEERSRLVEEELRGELASLVRNLEVLRRRRQQQTKQELLLLPSSPVWDVDPWMAYVTRLGEALSNEELSETCRFLNSALARREERWRRRITASPVVAPGVSEDYVDETTRTQTPPGEEPSPPPALASATPAGEAPTERRDEKSPPPSSHPDDGEGGADDDGGGSKDDAPAPDDARESTGGPKSPRRCFSPLSLSLGLLARLALSDDDGYDDDSSDDPTEKPKVTTPGTPLSEADLRARRAASTSGLYAAGLAEYLRQRSDWLDRERGNTAGGGGTGAGDAGGTGGDATAAFFRACMPRGQREAEEAAAAAAAAGVDVGTMPTDDDVTASSDGAGGDVGEGEGAADGAGSNGDGGGGEGGGGDATTTAAAAEGENPVAPPPDDTDGGDPQPASPPSGGVGGVASHVSSLMRKLGGGGRQQQQQQNQQQQQDGGTEGKNAIGAGGAGAGSIRWGNGGSRLSASLPPSSPGGAAAGKTVEVGGNANAPPEDRSKAVPDAGGRRHSTTSTSSATTATATTTTTLTEDDAPVGAGSPSSGGGSGSGSGSDSIGEDYTIYLHREMLGLTVENVLERTIIRTVLPHGAAKKSGAKVGSLIVRVGAVETANLTHFETIDELRQSNRPLRLVLRRIDSDDLVLAREEMGRLIRGGGFGGLSLAAAGGGGGGGADAAGAAGGGGASASTDGGEGKEVSLGDDYEKRMAGGDGGASASGANSATDGDDEEGGLDGPGGLALSLEGVVHSRWTATTPCNSIAIADAAETATPSPAPAGGGNPTSAASAPGPSSSSSSKRLSKRDRQLAKMSERLVWILTQFVIGLDYESANVEASASPTGEETVVLDGTVAPYVEAARSVSKIVLEYVDRHVNAIVTEGRTIERCRLGGGTGGSGGVNPPPGKPGRAGSGASPQQQAPAARGGVPATQKLAVGGGAAPPNTPHAPIAPQVQHSPLWQIGDVLHRARSFLADLPTLVTSNVVQTQLIGYLCDVLDFDTDMELSEFDEEDHSQQQQTQLTGRSGGRGAAGGAAAASAGNSRGGKGKAAGGAGGGGGGGVQDELGAAGSLLKLVVRNCCNGATCATSVAGLDDHPSSSSSLREQRRAEGGGGVKAKSSAVRNRSTSGNKFLAVVHRLAASRSTSARITACSLGPVLWGHLDFPHQLQLRGVITRALHDVEVIVRKSTAAVLHEIAELVFDPRSVPWLVLMCERAMTDPEPQLRAAAMTLTWHLAEHLPNAFVGDASKGSRSLSRLPSRTDPTFAEVYLLQCKLLPVATRLAEDRHPSVRLAVAAQCDRLCGALGDHWFSVIIDLLQALLGDTSEQVRAEATLCLPRLVDSVLVVSINGSGGFGGGSGGVSVLESLLPHALKLLKDSAPCVRVALATSCGELLTLLVGLGSYDDIVGGAVTMGDSLDDLKRHKRHIDETLIPLVQRLLHDTDPEVTSAALRAVTNASRGNVKEISSRRACIHHDTSTNGGAFVSAMPPGSPRRQDSKKNLTNSPMKEPVFIPVLSEAQVLRLLPTLSDLATSSQWRVRQSAVEIVPALLGCTQRLATRTEIAQLCVTLMGDSVDAVRKTAAECLCLGGGSLGGDGGGEWIRAIVIPNLKRCRDSESAKQRMLCLKMVEVLVRNRVCHSSHFSYGGSDQDSSSPLRVVLEVAASLSLDNVVNVRLNVGRVFRDVVEDLVDEADVSYVIKVVEDQLAAEAAREGGGDRDVLFFAKGALICAHDCLSECQNYQVTPPPTPDRKLLHTPYL